MLFFVPCRLFVFIEKAKKPCYKIIAYISQTVPGHSPNMPFAATVGIGRIRFRFICYAVNILLANGSAFALHQLFSLLSFLFISYLYQCVPVSVSVSICSFIRYPALALLWRDWIHNTLYVDSRVGFSYVFLLFGLLSFPSLLLNINMYYHTSPSHIPSSLFYQKHHL